MYVQHRERHRTDRIGWLRAAVLGANDGIVSTASLVVGVAAAHSNASDILVAGVAGMVAGGGWSTCGEGCHPCHFLGSPRDGADRRSRCDVRSGCLTPAGGPDILCAAGNESGERSGVSPMPLALPERQGASGLLI